MQRKIVLGVCAGAVACGGLSGCAKVAHLDQLLAIKAYSDNEEEKKQFVEAADKRFEALLHDVDTGRLSPATRQEDVRKTYGCPVYERELGDGAEAGTLWMYRRQIDYSGGDKVSLYFDARGGLLRWEKESPVSPRAGRPGPPEPCRSGLSVGTEGETAHEPILEKASPEQSR